MLLLFLLLCAAGRSLVLLILSVGCRRLSSLIVRPLAFLLLWSNRPWFREMRIAMATRMAVVAVVGLFLSLADEIPTEEARAE